MQIDVYSTAGVVVGQIELDDTVWGIEPNISVMHQALLRQLANARVGTHQTKTRGEVSGGGRKPWRQKGTGRARQGSIRAPQWQGGGVALGPKPRSYAQKTPKKMIRAALVSALSDRAAGGRVAVAADWRFDAPKTANALAGLKALGVEGRVLVVLSPSDELAAKSFRNLADVHILTPGQLNAYDVLCSDWIVFSQETLPGTLEKPTATPVAVGGGAEPVDETTDGTTAESTGDEV